jgi:hypothetical protein
VLPEVLTVLVVFDVTETPYHRDELVVQFVGGDLDRR